ncbi:MAG: translesion DNA synthesis-associated protein ImuA [Salinisphaera sp.]|nr:translesion DNA synthesis-associated protein ImuA [Salinisphaera sp.]
MIDAAAACNPALAELIGRHGLRRGCAQALQPALATRHSELDACLPGGGLPRGALTEVLAQPRCCGELRLLLPQLAQTNKRIAVIDPPHPPYAPALAHAGVQLARLLVVRADTAATNLWAAEQLLRSPLFGAVLCWTCAPSTAVRRLQVAAEAGGGVGLLYGQKQPATTAALRLAVTPLASGVQVCVQKCRGPAGAVVDCIWDESRFFPPHASRLTPHVPDVALPAPTKLRA